MVYLKNIFTSHGAFTRCQRARIGALADAGDFLTLELEPCEIVSRQELESKGL